MNLNQEWIRIYMERDANLFPFYLFAKSLGRDIKEFLGENLDPIILYFSKKGVEYFCSKTQIAQLGKEIYNKDVQGLHEKTIKEFDKWVVTLIKLIKKTEKKINQLSETETILKINEICLCIEKLNKYGQYSSLAEYGPNNYISGELATLVADKIKEKNLKLIAIKTTAILTSPIKETFFRKNLIKLMELACLIKKEKWDLNSNKVKNLIDIHWKNFLWLDYGYTGPPHDKKYFKIRIEEYLNNQNLEKEYLEKKKELEKIKQKQQRLEKKLNLSSLEKRRFWLAREIGFHKILRKEVAFFAIYILNELIQNLTKIWNIKREYFHYILPEEYSKEKLKELYESRKEELIYVIENKTEKIITGKEMKEIIGKIKDEKNEEPKKTEFQGRSAYHGKVKGIAKIVMGINHLNKIEKNDVLVSFATNPQMVIAMEKASAIITEQGGIACHAAIVARELKIPCVVGIDNITQQLNDGELIEVDANNGIIKILERKER